MTSFAERRHIRELQRLNEIERVLQQREAEAVEAAFKGVPPEMILESEDPLVWERLRTILQGILTNAPKAIEMCEENIARLRSGDRGQGT